jgi:CubicO group peptidase (beta-lactamase class C family)
VPRSGLSATASYLPGYAGPGRAALIRHLLTHTSGIPNFLTLPGFRDDAAHLDHTPARLMEVFAALPLEFPPGTRYGYSNSGYRLLDIIIERVTGTPFAEVITKRVFRPAGMGSARLLTDRAVIPWRARGYELAGRAYRMIPAGAAAYADESDPDTRLRVHASGLQPAVITIDYPFTWFTGYR